MATKKFTKRSQEEKWFNKAVEECKKAILSQDAEYGAKSDPKKVTSIADLKAVKDARDMKGKY